MIILNRIEAVAFFVLIYAELRVKSAANLVDIEEGKGSVSDKRNGTFSIDFEDIPVYPDDCDLPDNQRKGKKNGSTSCFDLVWYAGRRQGVAEYTVNKGTFNETPTDGHGWFKAEASNFDNIWDKGLTSDTKVLLKGKTKRDDIWWKTLVNQKEDFWLKGQTKDDHVWLKGQTKFADVWAKGQTNVDHVWFKGHTKDDHVWIKDKTDAVHDWIRGQTKDDHVWIRDQSDVIHDWVKGQTNDDHIWFTKDGSGQDDPNHGVTFPDHSWFTRGTKENVNGGDKEDDKKKTRITRDDTTVPDAIHSTGRPKPNKPTDKFDVGTVVDYDYNTVFSLQPKPTLPYSKGTVIEYEYYDTSTRHKTPTGPFNKGTVEEYDYFDAFTLRTTRKRRTTMSTEEYNEGTIVEYEDGDASSTPSADRATKANATMPFSIVVRIVNNGSSNMSYLSETITILLYIMIILVGLAVILGVLTGWYLANKSNRAYDDESSERTSSTEE